jgi:hypothetical protein
MGRSMRELGWVSDRPHPRAARRDTARLEGGEVREDPAITQQGKRRQARLFFYDAVPIEPESGTGALADRFDSTLRTTSA